MVRPVLAAALALLASPALAQTCTTSWIASGGLWSSGAWDDADRWDNGVPTASDVACILGPDGRASFTVTLSAPREVGGLVVGNEDSFGAVALQLDAELTVLGEGRLFGDDQINGDLTLEGPFEIEYGRLATQGGTVTVRDGGALVVAQSEGNGGNGGATRIGRTNSTADTLRLAGGRFEARESVYPSIRLEVDGGTIAVREDDREGNSTFLRFRGSGSLRDLSLDTDSGTTLTLRGAYNVSGAFSGTADGEAEFSRFSSVEVDAGGVEFAVGGDLGFALSNDDSGSASQLLVTTAGGEILNSGLLRVAFASTLDGATLRTTGTTQFDANTGSTLTLADGADLVVEDAGTVSFLGQSSVRGTSSTLGSPEGEERVVVRGRMLRDRPDSPGNAASIYLPVDVEGGTIEAASATLFLSGGGRLQNAELIGGQDAQLIFQNEWEAEGTLSGSALTDTRSGRGETSVRFTAGFRASTELRAVAPVTLALGGDGLTLGVSGSGAGTTVLTASSSGQFVNAGTVHIVGPTTIRETTLRNEGTFEAQGSALTLADGGRLLNPVGETVTLRGPLRAGDTPGTFQNEGLALIAGSVSFAGQLDARPGSELRLLEGTRSALSFFGVGDAPDQFGDGVAVTGAGQVSLPSGFALEGTVSPGTADAPVDTLRFGALALSDTDGDAELVIDLTAAGADHILASPGSGRTVELGGALVIRLEPGYILSPGDTWDLIRTARGEAIAGAFSSVRIEGGAPNTTFSFDTSQPGVLRLRAELPPAIQAIDADASERGPDPGAVVVYRTDYSDVDAPQPIPVRLRGEARLYSDYTADVTRGQVVVPARADSVVVGVYPMSDTETEPPEWVILDVRQGSAWVSDSVRVLDSPPDGGVVVYATSPARGTNLGDVTIVVSGEYLESGASVQLTGVGDPIAATSVDATDDGTILTAVFPLTQAPPGLRSLSVGGGGATRVVPDAFDIEAITYPDVLVTVDAPPRVGVGRRATYRVVLNNTGNYDVLGQASLAGFPEGTTWEVDYEVSPAGGGEPIPWHEFSPSLAADDGIAITLPPMVLPPGETRSLAIRAIIPDVRDLNLIGAWIYER